MQKQEILIASEGYEELDKYLIQNSIKRVLLVCDASIKFLKLNDYFNNLQKRLGIEVMRFSDFQSNPLYESVVEGVKVLQQGGCDAIIAVGGGSSIDVAKCIKLYSNMDANENYLKQIIIPNGLKLMAVPTTAGTGSEATRYAVIYYNGEKQSVTDYSCIPSTVLMDASVLETLPIYQKKSTMLDAFCHSIESFWSVNSTDESKSYSKQAIEMIMENMNAYIRNDHIGNANMLKAANLAGKAINITQTTAGHAMCYKLTSLYGIAHGHAAALCIRKLWPFMLENTNKCIDPRGEDYLKAIFLQIANAMRCKTGKEAAEKFQTIFEEMKLAIPKPKERDYAILSTSVNPVRLNNNPILLEEEVIEDLYRQILE